MHPSSFGTSRCGVRCEVLRAKRMVPGVSEIVGVHVVFTDLVGSTEISARLKPEAAEALRVVHFGLLRAAMEAHEGREVKNLGDGLMSVFPSLGSALDGAVAMQQAVERHNASGNEPLGIRVGLSSGDAVEEDGDYFGDPVVEAARLCANCEGGQIITSELISALARRTNHTFESIGNLELDGLPEPVPSVTVLWEPMQIECAVPMPDRLKAEMDLPIAGREQERDSLTQACKSAETGERRLTFLVGEPGIGKTRLCSELAAEAHGRGVLVLYGRCDEELAVPYQPWIEAIGYLLENSAPDLVEEVIRMHGPELAQLLPQLRRRYSGVETPHSTDPETERYLLLQTVASCISILGADSPVLLVLDDLHWADKPTLTLLRHLFTNMSASSLMMVATYRDSDLMAGHPLIDTIATLRREPGVELIPVRGLDDLAMVQLVQISAGHDLGETTTEMAIALRRETAGNPFFAHEILRNLVESGDLYQDDTGTWVSAKTLEELTIPQSVRDVVGQRTARLGEETLKSLTTASVIGQEFDVVLLADVSDSDEDDLLKLLEGAAAAGILTEVPGPGERYRFRHSLTRNTLQAGLSDGRRRRMHRRVAESLEAAVGGDPGDRVGELATHWLAAAEPVDGAKATHYARLAGQQAEAHLAPDEAVRWFATALEVLEHDPEPQDQARAELLVDLGTAQKHAGDPAYRQTLLDAGELAQRVGDVSLMAAAALANSRGFYSKLGAPDGERIDALEAAAVAIDEDRAADRAMLLATLVGELEFAVPLEVRMARFEEALSIARSVDDPVTLANVLNSLCVSLAVPQTLEARREASAESVAIAEELGDVTLRFWSRLGAFQAALGAGAADEAHLSLDLLTSAADECGRPSLRWQAGCLRDSILSLQGDCEVLERSAEETLTVGTDAGEPDAFEYFGNSILATRWFQGRLSEVIDQVRQAVIENPGVTTYPAVVAVFLAEGGDHEAARGLLREATDHGFENIPIDVPWSLTMSLWAEAAVIVNDADACRSLYDLLVPWSGQLANNRGVTLFVIDSVLGHLATVLGDYDRAEQHLAAAEELTRTFDAHFAAATDQLARARLHLTRGDAGDLERAEQHGLQAIDLARENGYADIEQRATAFLGALPEA